MMKEPIAEKSDVKRIMDSLPQQETNHMQRVGFLVDLLTSKLEESCQTDAHREDFPLYGQAAAYHDIGKAWVPKSILTKPGALTEKEINTVRGHPIYARAFFESVRVGLLTGIPEHLILLSSHSAVYHHEWWNGGGYPFGLSQENIPFIARVTSVCDAYDAITNERCYRPARAHDSACRELEINSGTQFDPEIVRIFLQYQEEICILINRIFPSEAIAEGNIQKGVKNV